MRRYARAGDEVGIIGAGSFGQISVAYAKALGYKTTLVATKKELTSYQPPEGVEVADDISKIKYRFHIILGTAASLNGESIVEQVSSVRRGGRFVVLGSAATEDFQLPFGLLVHEQREIVFVQSGSRRDIHDAL